MKERPIIFDAVSVRAILAGAKTQTRRVIKPQPEETYPGADIWMLSGKAVTSEYVNPVIGSDTLIDHYWHDVESPYGGGEYMDGTFDRLWVREAWYVQPEIWHKHHARQPIHYAECTPANQVEDYALMPAMFMPRWASRITLEVGTVRVERLQQISDVDIEAEMAWAALGDSAPANFSDRWNAINAERGWPWAFNPWVWVVEFRLVQS